MTTIIFVFVLFVAFVIAAAYFQISVRKDLKSCAVTRPAGTVATYTYTGKSGRLSEPFSNMGMEEHINLLITNGWEVVNQTGLPGHVRLGRTLTGAALTGGLSLLAGGSRTADRVSITYRRVRVVKPISGVESDGETCPQNNEAFQNVQNSTPISASSMLMDDLKEELFQLEVERRQGRISEEEYQGNKATFIHILERTLKRQTIAGTESILK